MICHYFEKRCRAHYTFCRGTTLILAGLLGLKYGYSPDQKDPNVFIGQIELIHKLGFGQSKLAKIWVLVRPIRTKIGNDQTEGATNIFQISWVASHPPIPVLGHHGTVYNLSWMERYKDDGKI